MNGGRELHVRARSGGDAGAGNASAGDGDVIRVVENVIDVEAERVFFAPATRGAERGAVGGFEEEAGLRDDAERRKVDRRVAGATAPGLSTPRPAPAVPNYPRELDWPQVVCVALGYAFPTLPLHRATHHHFRGALVSFEISCGSDIGGSD